MADGQMFPVSRPSDPVSHKQKRFLLALQFYEGDREAAGELANLIADLERTRNHNVDILLFRRSDARELSIQVRDKLAAKFNKVASMACRRTDAKSYPWAPNAMFYDLVSILAQEEPYRSDYYAFINMETDAVPTRPGWLSEIISAWKVANSEGVAAIGHIQEDPSRHLNGLAVYSSDLWTRVGSKKLSGGNPQIAFDIWHSDSILPLSKDCPLIRLKYKQPTITSDELYAVHQNGVKPAVYHGVKDGTARAAVRARHINFTEKTPEPERPNVYTYFHNPAPGMNGFEHQDILSAWRKGWASKGWNPVVLSKRDAVRNPRFAEFEAALDKLPSATTDRERWKHQFHRWLALDSVGGGLLTDYDVLPNTLTPTSLPENGVRAFRSNGGGMFAAFQNKNAMKTWIKHIEIYDAQPDDMLEGAPNVTDDAIMLKMHKAETETDAMIHFGSENVGNERKSVAMERFLRGT